MLIRLVVPAQSPDNSTWTLCPGRTTPWADGPSILTSALAGAAMASSARAAAAQNLFPCITFTSHEPAAPDDGNREQQCQAERDDEPGRQVRRARGPHRRGRLRHGLRQRV